MAASNTYPPIVRGQFESVEHYNLREQTVKLAVRLGLKVLPERKVFLKSGKQMFCDILVEKDGKKIPVECGTTALDKVNVLLRQFDEIWLMPFGGTSPMKIDKGNFLEKGREFVDEMDKQKIILGESKKKEQTKPLTDIELSSNYPESPTISSWKTVLDLRINDVDNLDLGIKAQRLGTQEVFALVAQMISVNFKRDRDKMTDVIESFLIRAKEGMSYSDKETKNFMAYHKINRDRFYDIRLRLITVGLIEKRRRVYVLSNKFGEFLGKLLSIWSYARS